VRYFAVVARQSLVAQAPEEAFALVLPGRAP
jgi:hypothetical protein